jgi:hypothetical protein
MIIDSAVESKMTGRITKIGSSSLLKEIIICKKPIVAQKIPFRFKQIV